MVVLFFYIVMFSIQITVCRSRHFYSDLSVFDGPNFTNRILFLTFPFLLSNKKLYE
jgi:hypothetical protein